MMIDPVGWIFSRPRPSANLARRLLRPTHDQEVRMALESVNPTTGKLIHEYPEMSREEAAAAVEAAHRAFLGWRAGEPAARKRGVAAGAGPLRAGGEEAARL